MTTKKSEHAWVQGRAEMDRMFGDLALTRRQWMITALIAMTTSIVLAIGMVTLTLTNRNAPWIVEVDQLGEIRMAGLAADVEIPEQARVATLHRLIINMRQIPGSPHIMAAQHKTVLAHLANEARVTFTRDLQTSAETLSQMLNERQQRYVSGIQSVLPFPGDPDLYRVTWTEEYEGRRTEQVSYEGFFKIQESNIPTNELALLNPLGLFITEYTFSTITSDS